MFRSTLLQKLSAVEFRHQMIWAFILVIYIVHSVVLIRHGVLDEHSSLDAQLWLGISLKGIFLKDFFFELNIFLINRVYHNQVRDCRDIFNYIWSMALEKTCPTYIYICSDIPITQNVFGYIFLWKLICFREYILLDFGPWFIT